MEKRPLACSHCQKKADVIYSEIENGAMITYHMCRDCPVLQRKLYENSTYPDELLLSPEEELRCTQCQTTLEAVLMGEPLGCQKCYHIFQQALVDQLMEREKISPSLKLTQAKRLHVGESSHTAEESNPLSNQIVELNTALHQALKVENYEQAASLRDQINALTKRPP